MGRYHYARTYGDGADSSDEEIKEQSVVRYEQYRNIHGLVAHSSCYDNDEDTNENVVRNGFFLQPIPPHYDSDPSITEKKRSIFSHVWLWTIAIGVAAFLIRVYGPPCPPPKNRHDIDDNNNILSWSEYFIYEGSQCLSSLLSMSYAVGYACQWSCTGLKDDAFQAWNHILHKYDDFQQSRRYVCPMKLPSVIHDSNDDATSLSKSTTKANNGHQSFFENSIVGQNIAISAVSESLDAWDMDKKIHEDNQSQKSSPLLLLLSGSEGVGKMEMAKQISNLMFSHCTERQKEQHGFDGFNEGVLMLNGEDFPDTKEEAEISDADMTFDTNTASMTAIKENLFHQIGSHIHRQKGKGAVVVIHHVENMSQAIFAQLHRHLSSLRSLLPYLKDLSNHDHDHEISSQRRVEVACDNVIFIFTTRVGLKTLFRALRKYGNLDGVPKNDLDLVLRDEIENRFDGIQSSLSSFAVIPFAPLFPEDMKAIFRVKVDSLSAKYEGKQWYQLVATEKASAHIVQKPHVEYHAIQMVGGADSTAAYVSFSAEGAKPFLNHHGIMRRLKSQIKRCLLPSLQPDRIVVLDYDTEDAMALFRSCDAHPTTDTTTNHLDGELLYDHTSCQEICRYSLS